MPVESDKIMFMIYRDTTYTDKYRVVYFTELDEHNKEAEINKAFSGVHYHDGFIKNFKKDKAKEIIDRFIERLNKGEDIPPSKISKALDEFIPK